MKRFVFLIIAATMVFYVASAQASTIAVVNLGKIMSESKAGKAAKAEIDTLISAKKMVINRKISQIKKLAQKLSKKNLSKKEKEKLTSEYQAKIQDLEKYKSEAADEIRQKEQKLSAKIINAIINVIKNYAIAHKIDAVFEIGQGINTIYWNDKIDITNKILDLYNKEYSAKK